MFRLISQPCCFHRCLICLLAWIGLNTIVEAKVPPTPTRVVVNQKKTTTAKVASVLSLPLYCNEQTIFSQDFGTSANPLAFPTALETTAYALAGTNAGSGFGYVGVGNSPQVFNTVFFSASQYPFNRGSFLTVDPRDSGYPNATSVYTRSLTQNQLQAGVYEVRFWMRNAIAVWPGYNADLPTCPNVQLQVASSGAVLTGRLVGPDYTSSPSCPTFPMEAANTTSSPNYGWKELIYLFDAVPGPCSNLSIIPPRSSTYGGADFVLDEIQFNKLRTRPQVPPVVGPVFAYRCGTSSDTYVNLELANAGTSRLYAWYDNGVELVRTHGTRYSQLISANPLPRTFTVVDVTEDCHSEPTSFTVYPGPADSQLDFCAAGTYLLHGPDPTQIYNWYDNNTGVLLGTGVTYSTLLTRPLQRFRIKVVPNAIPASTSDCASVIYGTVTTKIKANLLYLEEFGGGSTFNQANSLAVTDYSLISPGVTTLSNGQATMTNYPYQSNSGNSINQGGCQQWRGQEDYRTAVSTHCIPTPVNYFLLLRSTTAAIGQNSAAWRYTLGPLSGRLDARAGPGRAFEVRFIMRSAFDGNYIQCPEVKLRYGNSVISAEQINKDNSYTTYPCSSGSANTTAFQNWQEMRYVVYLPDGLDLMQYNNPGDVSIAICPAFANSGSCQYEAIQLDRVELYNFNGENVNPIVTKASAFLCTPGNMDLTVSNTVQGNTYEILDSNGTVIQPSQTANFSGSPIVFTVSVVNTTNFFIRNSTSNLNPYPYPNYDRCPASCLPPSTLVTVPVSNTLSTPPDVSSKTRCGVGNVFFQVNTPIPGRDYEWLNGSGTVIYPDATTPPDPVGHYTTFLAPAGANAATGNVTTYKVRLRGNPPECPALIQTITATANIVAIPNFSITANSGAGPYYRGNIIAYVITAPVQPSAGQTITYRWDWGDFSPQETLTATSAEHQFTRAGTYGVRVVATQTFANASPVCMAAATNTIVIKEPLCELSVPLTGGTFSNNSITGAINYVNTSACAPTYTFECLSGQPQVVPGVVSFTATAFTDTLVQDDVDYRQGIYEANPFLAGKYRQRPYATYSYSTALSEQTANFDAGTFSLPAFDWSSSARARPAAWLAPAFAVKVSPDGDVLVERDPLGTLSTAKFGYGRADANLPLGSSTTTSLSVHALPYLQAHNTNPGTLAFESFENLIGNCPLLYGDDYLSISCGELSNASFFATPAAGGIRTSTARRHTGRFAGRLAPLFNNKWQLTLKSIPLTSQVQAEGVLVKVWVYNPDNLLGTVELIDKAEDYSIVESTTLAAVESNGLPVRNGDWVLYSALIKITNPGLYPSNYQLAPRLTFTRGSTGSATSEIWVDDIRIQPARAQMTAYVYDPDTFQLIASFDDQHFGLLYQYNPEGKLIRKQVETERGLKTIQETQYNTAKNP